MKPTPIVTLSLAFLRALAAFGQSNVVTDYELGISPHLTQSDAQRFRQKIVSFVLEAPPGSSIQCDDAYNLQSIAAFEIPRLKFDSPANRMRQLARPLAALAQWFTSTAGNPRPAELKGSGALKAPEWLQHISSQPVDHNRAVLLIGSPLYINLNEPAFSMPPDLYPGDGHLVASAEQSIFGLPDNRQCLSNRIVHWLYPNESVWANELHGYYLKRFWCLYMSLRSGCLADISADLNGVFARLPKSGLAPLGHFEVERADTKLTMRVARPREIPRWMPPGGLSTNSPVGQVATLAPLPAKTPQPAKQSIELPWQQPGSVVRADRTARPVVFAVGLMWQQHADVDLYLTPPGAPELWYRNVLGPSGRYLHDFRDSNAGHDYEWVELWNPVDPGQVEAWVNYFQGEVPVRGTVCVYCQGKTYLSAFELPATHGNAGLDRLLRSTSPYWTKLDIVKIIQQGPAN